MRKTAETHQPQETHGDELGGFKLNQKVKVPWDDHKWKIMGVHHPTNEFTAVDPETKHPPAKWQKISLEELHKENPSK